MGVSNKLDSAIGMGLATTFVLTLASAAGWMLEHWLLQPFGLGFLRILAFILVIAAVVQFTEMVIKKMSPALYQVLGIFLPLITTNCAVLGIALLNVQETAQFSAKPAVWLRFRRGFHLGDGDFCRVARTAGTDADTRCL